MSRLHPEDWPGVGGPHGKYESCPHGTRKTLRCYDCQPSMIAVDGTTLVDADYGVAAATVIETQGNRNQPGHGVKSDHGKLQWHLVPFRYLEGMVRVLMKGAVKYSPNNWRRGMPHTQPGDALLRHYFAWQDGEDTDVDSGEHHLDHLLCEALFLRGYTIDYPALDDRYKHILPAIPTPAPIKG